MYRLLRWCVGATAYAAGFVGVAALGWFAQSYLIPCPLHGVGLLVPIVTFFLWQLLLSFLAGGVVFGGRFSDDAECILGVTFGLVFGATGGGSVAGYLGVCFGIVIGLSAGIMAGRLRWHLGMRHHVRTSG